MAHTTLTIALSRHHLGGYRLVARVAGPNDERELELPLPLSFADVTPLDQALNPRKVGAQLTRALFGAATLRTFVREAAAASHPAPLAVQLALGAGCEELHTYPWEQLLDPEHVFDQQLSAEQADFWFQGQRCTFARRLPQPDQRRPPVAPRHAMRALVLIAAPHDAGAYKLAPIDTLAEWQALQTALAPFAQVALLARGPGKAVGPPTLSHLRDQLYHRPQLVYLLCHGSADPEGANAGRVLWLENEHGAAQRVAVAELAAALRSLSGPPPLVVLGACQGAGHEHDPLTTAEFGPALVEAGAGAVLAMRGNLLMADGRALIPKLLERLADHSRIELALAEARAQMPPDAEWWRAVLFLRGSGGPLWRRVEGYDQLLSGLLRWRNAATATRAFSDDEIRALADLIAACGAFEQPQQREALLQTLAPEQQHQQNLLLRLLDQLWLYEGESPERTAVAAWLDQQQLELPIALARLNELRAIFGRAAPHVPTLATLEHCLTQAFEFWGAPRAIGGATTYAWLEAARLHLGALEQRHERYQPLLDFCRELAVVLKAPPVQAELQAWVATVAAELGFAAAPAAPTAANGAPFEAYLCLIVKRADPRKPFQLELRALFFPGGPGADPREPELWERISLERPLVLPEGIGDDLSGAKARIVAHLQALIEQVSCRLLHRSLMIELLLPDTLWSLGGELLDVKLGEGRFAPTLAPSHPMALRLLDRSALAPAQRDYPVVHGNRWALWKQRQLLDKAACHWVRSAADCDPETLFAVLKYGEKQCVIGLVTPPDPAGVAAAICAAGTPIALWLVADGDAADVPEATLEQLLAEGRGLPEAIYRLRKQAWQPGGQDSPGRRLSLLWDNPNRPPPALTLQPLQ